MDAQLLAMIDLLLVALAVMSLLIGRRQGVAAASRLAAVEADRRELSQAHMQLQRQHAEEATLVVERTHQRDQANEALGLVRAEVEARRAEVATLAEKLAQERQQAARDLALLQQTREAMTQQFKLIGDEIMQRHSEDFARKNIEQLDGTLTPLRQKILEFQQSLQAAHTDSEKERARLAEQIRTLSVTSGRMSRETHDLTRALKGKSQMQGAWGEMILQTILEKSGLREGEEYVVQQGQITDEGGRLRPDVVVHLPNEQRIVIDAKVSLTAYAASVSADTDEERAAQLRAHVGSMRQHVKSLAGKEYHKHAAGVLDYVVMFVPIEGALAAALTEAPELTEFAVGHSVYIATPTTLMIALRTAANVWHVERRNRNADEIAARAGRVYDKVFLFVGSMDRLGRAIGSAHEHYDRAMGQLARGNGNVLWQLEQLKALGAKTNKSLPASLLDADAPASEAPADEADEQAAA
jgi:DNA recombination protein RmuC